MDDNISVDSEYRQKIIEKCINSSYQTGKAINNSPNNTHVSYYCQKENLNYQKNMKNCKNYLKL